jgi:triphosphoribosyl-dephospho-CoA synthase
MTIDDVVYFAQLSAVLEVSCEKPGNVTPSHSFSDVSYDDYLLGSVALGSAVRAAVEAGMRNPSNILLGELILKGAEDVKSAHSGGNTHLGTLMLFIPLAAAAGRCLAEKIPFREGLRAHVKEVLSAATLEDSLSFYEAVKVSGAGGLASGLREPQIPFPELMTLSSRVDRVADELSTGMRLTFDFSVPALGCAYSESDDLGVAVLRTYLIVLSEFPDSLIAKKAGAKKSADVSKLAQDVLSGDVSLEYFDSHLRSEGNVKNPGTTADLISAALFVSFLLECI